MELSAWLVIAYILTILGVIATVLSENRNPLKASAWIFIVGLIPVFGLMAYIVFGQDQRRLHSISRRFYRRLMRRPQRLALPEHLLKRRQVTEEHQQIIQLLQRNSNSPLLQLESMEVYTWGYDMYEALFVDLERAEEYIHLQAYIFGADTVLDRLTELLVRKAEEGVTIRIIYDHLGSYDVPSSYWRRMREAGIQVYAFMRVAFPLLSTTVNYRNHRKIVVIDGSIGYVGGMNFAQRYLSDWYTVSRKVVNMDRYFDPNALANAYSPSIQFVQGGPFTHWHVLEQAIIYLISRANRSIAIETPYFLPTENLNNALITAALAGVKVELMIPDRTDSRLTTYAANSYLAQLLEAGVEVYRYQAGFLHSKLLLIDERIASIGSANMDFRSLEHNFEIAGILYDEGMTRRLRQIFEEDKRSCLRLEAESWAQRGWRVRFAESFMRLFAPLL